MDTRDFHERMNQAENGRDWESLSALLAEEVVITHPGIGPVSGRDANLATFQFILGAIDGYHRSASEFVAEGDRCAFRFTITGTHTGDLPGYPATGQPVEIVGALFAEVRDGQLLRATEMLEHDSIRGISLR